MNFRRIAKEIKDDIKNFSEKRLIKKIIKEKELVNLRKWSLSDLKAKLEAL